jgi:hypothetical protein
MTNQEKAIVYDQLLFESDKLQRENSKLKSQHVGNIPPDVQLVIDRNNARIAVLVGRLESLFQ